MRADAPIGPSFADSIGKGPGVPGSQSPGQRWEARVLWTIFVILLILWLLGIVGVYTIGSFIHILLILAIISILIRVIYGEYPFGPRT